jgi:hypothetical protein
MVKFWILDHWKSVNGSRRRKRMNEFSSTVV